MADDEDELREIFDREDEENVTPGVTKRPPGLVRTTVKSKSTIVETKELAADLDALDALEAEATPGPWHYYPKTSPNNIIQTNHFTRDIWHIPHHDGDRPFIAALRNAYPALARELKELRQKVNGGSK